MKFKGQIVWTEVTLPSHSSFITLNRLTMDNCLPPWPLPGDTVTMWSASCLLLAVTSLLARADVYLHNPRGSNNRLNERSAERRNANRVFDSQVSPLQIILMSLSFGLMIIGLKVALKNYTTTCKLVHVHVYLHTI